MILIIILSVNAARASVRGGRGYFGGLTRRGGAAWTNNSNLNTVTNGSSYDTSALIVVDL